MVIRRLDLEPYHLSLDITLDITLNREWLLFAHALLFVFVFAAAVFGE